jgi:hypothetical protein
MFVPAMRWRRAPTIPQCGWPLAGGRSAADRARGDRTIEGDESAAMADCKAKQVQIGQRPRRPTLAGAALEPSQRVLVRRVACVQQRDQHVDVEQRTHQYASSSRNESSSSLVTIAPLAGKGRNPYTVRSPRTAVAPRGAHASDAMACQPEHQCGAREGTSGSPGVRSFRLPVVTANDGRNVRP